MVIRVERGWPVCKGWRAVTSYKTPTQSDPTHAYGLVAPKRDEPALCPSSRGDGGRLPRNGACYFLPLPEPAFSSLDSTAMKASCGTSTEPTIFIRFLPSFCFSSSFRLREMSPP